MAALPPRHRHPDQENDQANLQDQAEQRRQAADPAEHAATEQQTEQARTEEARGETAEHAAAGPVEQPAACCRRAVPALPGWPNVRLNGCAVPGAVDVLGGAEKVRAPREPELKPPPARASADAAASISGNANDKTTAIA